MVGVGLGNIFGNSPITLRSQGVQPVRRQDIASSEKKDGPELKVYLTQIPVECRGEPAALACMIFAQQQFCVLSIRNPIYIIIFYTGAQIPTQGKKKVL